MDKMQISVAIGIAIVSIGSAVSQTVDPSTSDDAAATSNWIGVGGDPGCMRYSSLDQINHDNVRELEVAWTFHTGELDRAQKKTIECRPIIVDGAMYISTQYHNACPGAGAWSTVGSTW